MPTLFRCALAGIGLFAGAHAPLRCEGAATISSIPEALRPTSSGERRLPSGHVAKYEYHYDRNALGAVHVSAADILAITEAGTLLRYDPCTLRVTAELIPDHSEASCIGDDAAGRPLVGLADGRVCRTDATRMRLEEIGRVDGRPIWVGGAREGGEGARITLCLSTKLHEKTGDPSRFEVRVLGRGKVGQIIGRSMTSFSAFLVDSKGRLWLGEDRGEWGGACHLFDPSTGKVATMAEPPESGIYGFLETADGRILCHGGTMHLTLLSQFVSQLEMTRGGLKAIPLHERSNWQPGVRAAKADDAMCIPITRMLQGGQESGFTVFAFNDVYRVTPDFKQWTKAGTVDARLREGRPDAVGSYPGIGQVFARGERLEDGFLCSTLCDGLFAWRNGDVTTGSPFPDQIGLDGIFEMHPSDFGLLLEGLSRDLPWRWSGAGWAPLDLVPPFKPKNRDDAWSSHAVKVRPDGVIVTLSSGRWSPGTRAIVEWRKGKPKLISEETDSTLWDTRTFFTPDGGIWTADSGRFWRLDGGRWVNLHAVKNPPWDAEVVNPHGPPWILLDYTIEDAALVRVLSRLSYGPGFDKPTLTRLIVKDGDGTALAVDDARPWTDGRVILATDRGVRILRPDRDEASKPDFATPSGRVRRLCRDGRGRLWFAGEGLWMLDDGALVDVSDLPMFGKAAWECLEHDPDDPDRVAVGLGRRGMVLVRVVKGRATELQETDRRDK